MLSVDQTPEKTEPEGPAIPEAVTKLDVLTREQASESILLPNLMMEDVGTSKADISENMKIDNIEPEPRSQIEVPAVEVQEEIELYDLEVIDDILQSDKELAAELVNEHEVADVTEETLADPEIITLQAELLELVLLEEAAPKQDAISTEEIIEAYEQQVETTAASQPLLKFENVIVPEERPSQSVESLAVYLNQAADTELALPAKAVEITNLLIEVSELLEESDDGLGLQEVLTTEVVEKLVELFENLGYEKPHQAVKEYFQDSGAVEGLSILRYLANLARAYDAQENTSRVMQAAKDESSVNRLGRILLQLVALQPRTQEV